MITIHKYELSTERFQTLDVHAGAGLPLALFVVNDAGQYPTPTVWFCVDDTAPIVKRDIFCIRDGEDSSHLIRQADHIASVALPPSGVVLHYFAKRFL